MSENKNITLNKVRKNILSSNGHLLIEGGPGTGKTTIALYKAKNILEEKRIRPYQKILFLSFARATISRVEEHAKDLVSAEIKKSIEINTYHGFAWSIIKNYGYLLKGKESKNIKLITPPNLTALLAEITQEARDEYKKQLFLKEGLLCFDLFSNIAHTLLSKSDKIRSIISLSYPYIIVDEFQDTDDQEWFLIKELGKSSTIIALADLNQRIYDFRGASVSRIPEFKKHFLPTEFDLGVESNRSPNTDIVNFGDDILTGKNIGKKYTDVSIVRYQYYHEIKDNLKYTIQKSIKRLKESKGWSIAVLVKTRQDVLAVSSYLSSQNYQHEVIIDPSGPALAASIIARVMEDSTVAPDILRKHLIYRIISHIKGRKEKLTQEESKLCKALERYIETGKISGSKRELLVNEINEIVEKRTSILFIGKPVEDWIAIRQLFQQSKHVVLKNIFADAQYIRLLNKGTLLNEKLSEMWRTFNSYLYASEAIDDALATEHFSMANRVWKGIVVMNIHKSKGKEFDEVVIWEEQYRPLVHPESTTARIQQDRLLLRVAVTRAKKHTTFLTPKNSPCILL